MSNFSFSKRLRSFKFAFAGIKLLFKHEHNAWIHLAIAILTILGGLYFDLSNVEWSLVILTIGVVIAAEAFNTAIEQISNFIQPEQDKRIEYIKDLAAGGVLITGISAFFVGLIIFLPKFINLFNS
jgi:diacylglycerol kinase (ATP)